MMKTLVRLAVACVILGAGLLAVVPQKWSLESYGDFLKGKFEGIAISSEGVLSLALKEEAVEGPAEEFYLSLLVGPDGALFLGTGHGGKVYRVPKEGKPDLYFQAPEMDVTSLALDSKGILYAGTSPNGKVYKITEKGKAAEFFNPGEKYIWALHWADEGRLLAAVGESGGIYEVNAEGEGRLILKVQENHVLCLKQDPSGDLIAGSGGKGLVYRISKSGRASVLFESQFEEIKSLDLDGQGNILAAASGKLAPAKSRQDDSFRPALDLPGLETEVTVTAGRPAVPAQVESLAAAASTREPSALFLIGPDGTAKALWRSNEEMIYSLMWRESEKRAVFGSGNNGRLYAVDKEGRASLLLQKSSEQVYLLVPGGSKSYMVLNNPARVDALLSEQRFDGQYVSEVLDGRTISTWGLVHWAASVPQDTSLQLQTRSGNSSEPGPTWSDWSPPYNKKEGEQILSPKARYLQFRALFKTPSGRVSPQLQRVELFHLETNIAPVVLSLVVSPPNEVLLAPPDSKDEVWGLAKSSRERAGEKQSEQDAADRRAMVMAKKTERKGLQTIIWDADDENDDGLVYTLLIRREGEADWRVLEEDWEESLYAFDSATLPDGRYVFKVIASDAPANPLGAALTAERVSLPLTVDNSVPVIRSLSVTRDKGGLAVSFEAEDSLSPLIEAQFYVRPGRWQAVVPLDGICDARQEKFSFTVSLPAKADNLITLRVKDGHGNVGVARQVF